MSEGARTEDDRSGPPATPGDRAGVKQSDAAALPTSAAARPPEPKGPGGGPGEHIGTFHAFRYHSYRLLWLGDLLTAAAMWTQQTALGWVVYDLTGSGQILGGISAVRIFPTLFITPIAGAATDLYSRNRIIAVSQFAMFLLTLAVAAGLALHKIEIWHLFAFTILVGTAQTFNMPARQTFVFDLVPRSVIPNAVALSWLAFSLARSLGPAVGGLLIVIMGPAENFFLQSLAYLGVMATILTIKAPPRTQPAVRRSFWGGLREGYGFAFSDRRARLMVVMSIVSPLFIIPLHSALLPIFAEKSFNAGAGGLGILVGAIGFGGLLGGLLTASLNRVDRRGMLQLIALFVFSLSETAFSLVALLTGSLALAVPLLVLAGVAESVYTTTNTAMLQLLAPEHLRGSMAAVLQLSFLFMPLGALAVGTAADSFGAPAVGAVTTFMAFAVGLAMMIFSPTMRQLRLSELGQATPPAR